MSERSPRAPWWAGSGFAWSCAAAALACGIASTLLARNSTRTSWKTVGENYGSTDARLEIVGHIERTFGVADCDAMAGPTLRRELFVSVKADAVYAMVDDEDRIRFCRPASVVGTRN